MKSTSSSNTRAALVTDLAAIVGFKETTSVFDSVNELTNQFGAQNRILAYDENGNLTHDGSKTCPDPA